MPIPDTVPVLGISWADVLFLVLAGVMLGSALLVVTLRDIIRCGLALIVSFGALAGLYVLPGPPVLAAGAILSRWRNPAQSAHPHRFPDRQHTAEVRCARFR